MLNLEWGHGPRSLAMKDVDTYVFEMLVSTSNDRNNKCLLFSPNCVSAPFPIRRRIIN